MEKKSKAWKKAEKHILKKYAEDLGRALRTFDFKQVDKFINSQAHLFEKETIDKWNALSDEIKDVEMCNMILSRTDMSTLLRNRAILKLKDYADKGVIQDKPIGDK